jgi:hypothetical protein
VRVLSQLSIHALQADGVCHLAHCETGLVQHRDDALMGLFHKVHDDLVVKVVNLETHRGKGTVKCRLLNTACVAYGSVFVERERNKREIERERKKEGKK